MEERVLLNDRCSLILKRGNDVIEERKIDGNTINLLEELCKIFSNTRG